MGRPRGQRNAAREKVWPGTQAVHLRELKRDSGTVWEAAEEAANELLGETPLEYSFKFGPHQPFSLTGKSFADPDVRKISSAPIEKKKLKATKGACSNCNSPIYSFNGLCRVCYRLAAKEKYEKKVTEKHERISGYQHWAPMTSAFEAPGGRDDSDSVYKLIRVQEDFVPELLEIISDIENEEGVPFVHVQPPRERKPLFHSNSGPHPMFSQPNQAARIRYRRPKWKTLRGQWA